MEIEPYLSVGSDEATASIGRPFNGLGYELFECWENGRSSQSGNIYIVVKQSPALTSGSHHDWPVNR